MKDLLTYKSNNTNDVMDDLVSKHIITIHTDIDFCSMESIQNKLYYNTFLSIPILTGIVIFIVNDFK